MIVSGEAFSKRLESLSDDTIRMISVLAKHSKKHFIQALDVVKTTESEEEIVGELKRMKKELKL